MKYPMTDRLHLPESTVLIVAGPAASGKTTFATSLAFRLSYSLFDLDQVTGPLVSYVLASRDEPEHALDEGPGMALRDARYASLMSAASANISVGRHVVIAAPFTKEVSDAEAWERMLQTWVYGDNPIRRSVRVELLYLQCPESVLRERLARRGEARDLLKIAGAVESHGMAPTVAFHAVDGLSDAEAQVDALLSRLSPQIPQIHFPLRAPHADS
ncbi:MAG TPA: AAA family ATPase [Acidimicrobiales bacterium]